MQHPNNQSVSTGAIVSFCVEATGDDLHFQWQRDHIDLQDGDKCCGTLTNRLHIVEVEVGDKGRYRCLVKNPVGKEFSHEAFLIVSKLIILYALGNVLKRNVSACVQTNLICTPTSLAKFMVYFCRNPCFNS